MKIFVEDTAENVVIEESVTRVVEVSDAIFPPGLSSDLIEAEGDLIVGLSEGVGLRLPAPTSAGLSPVSDLEVSGFWKLAIPGSVGLALWNAIPGDPVRGSNTTITLNDADNANGYDSLLAGTCLKWTDTGATKRAVVVSTSYAGGTVTLTLSGDVCAATADSSTFQYTRNHRELQASVTGPETIISAAGDSKANILIPQSCDGFHMVWVYGVVDTVSSSGVVGFQLNDGSNDLLTTNCTIDQSENHSKTAATPAVINVTYRQLDYGDLLDIDVDNAGTGAKGLIVGIVLSPS